MNQFPLWTLLATYLALSVAVKAPRNIPPSRVTSSTDTKMSELENTQKQLKIKVTSLAAQRDSLNERVLAIEERLATQEELVAVEELLIASENKNQELMKMLSNYERFFGTLYAETPESFDPTEGVDVRLSKLNSYLGNREAELLSLRPAPPTVVDNSTVNQELLGEALYDIQQERNMMDKKLRRLQENLERVERRVPGHALPNIRQGELINEEPAVVPEVPPARGQSGSRGNQKNVNVNGMVMETSCDGCRAKRSIDETSSFPAITNDEISDRLERLEDLMVLQLLPLINQTFSQDGSFRTAASASVLTHLTQLEELEEEISALNRGSRPDSKKVAFSVARTTHMLGTTLPQLLDFDHVFLNKGGDFDEENSTFICSVPGYYLVTFTVRSFDGYVLGINLMKNDEPVTSVFTDADERRNVMDSQTVIVHLDIGDHMWLRHPPSTRFAVHSDRYKYTTFSSFLIYKGY